MLVLLPPSREKSEQASRVPWHRGALGAGPLAGARREVVDAARLALERASGDEHAMGRLLDAGGGAVGPAAAALHAIDERPTAAWLDRYRGILFRTLHRDGMDGATRARAERQLAVHDALWGVVSGRDAIPDARLSIAARLPGLGVVGSFWRDRLGALLDDVARERVVVDLRSSGFDRTWRPAADARAVITVRFLRTERDRAEASAFGKQRKGALARVLVDAGIPDDADVSAVVEAAASLTAGTRASPDESDLGVRHPTLVFRAEAT